jgi:hypothetical protein
MSARSGVLPYKQLIRPMIDYACLAWRSAAGTMSGDYKCYNQNVFAFLLVPPERNMQIRVDLDVPLFADHIRALTASFDSMLAEVGNPLVRQLGRYLR